VNRLGRLKKKLVFSKPAKSKHCAPFELQVLRLETTVQHHIGEIILAVDYEDVVGSRISGRNTILLARLALFCVEHAEMGRYSAAIGLKSDSTIWAQMDPRDFAETASQSGKREIRLVL
jgi:hypothetical protein